MFIPPPRGQVKSRLPLHQPRVGRGQHHQAKHDPVPSEHGEIVRGDVADQPADAQPGTEKGEDGSDGKHRQVRPLQQVALLPHRVGAGAHERGNAQEEAELGGALA